MFHIRGRPILWAFADLIDSGNIGIAVEREKWQFPIWLPYVIFRCLLTSAGVEFIDLDD